MARALKKSLMFSELSFQVLTQLDLTLLALIFLFFFLLFNCLIFWYFKVKSYLNKSTIMIFYKSFNSKKLVVSKLSY